MKRVTNKKVNDNKERKASGLQLKGTSIRQYSPFLIESILVVKYAGEHTFIFLNKGRELTFSVTPCLQPIESTTHTELRLLAH